MNLTTLSKLNDEKTVLASKIAELRTKLESLDEQKAKIEEEIDSVENEMAEVIAGIKQELDSIEGELDGDEDGDDEDDETEPEPAKRASKPPPKLNGAPSADDARVLSKIPRNRPLKIAEVASLLRVDVGNKAAMRRLAASLKNLAATGDVTVTGEKRGTKYTRV